MTSESAATRVRRACFGFFVYKPRWGLSRMGASVVVLTILGGALVTVLTAYPFLAINARVPTNVLVVEGWVGKFAIKAAVEEFSSRGYARIYCTGGPVVGLGGYVNDFQTAASVGTQRLKEEGIPSDKVVMVPSRQFDRDRTFGSAVALRRWLEENDAKPQAINVLTEALHARRTRLLYQKVFGRSVAVGIIGVPSPDYSPNEWYRYSEGVKDVLSEIVAYLYARIFFWPAEHEAPVPARSTASPAF